MLVPMEQKGLRKGHFLALAGALLAVASLWRPWYTVEIPQAMRDLFGAQGMGSDPGLLGQMSRGLAAQLPSEVSASGWRELEGADVAVVVAALAVVALIVGAAGALSAVRVDPGAIGGLIAAAGAAIVVVAVAHVVSRPGGGQASEWVHVSDGLWLALAGGAAVLAGGLWSTARPGAAGARRPAQDAPSLAAAFPPLTPELPPVFAEASGSVAPPPAEAA
jgi:hypothetical protein